MLRCNYTPSIHDEEALDEAGDPLLILMRLEERAEREERQDQIEEKQARDRERIAKVLLPGDSPVHGLSPMASEIGRSPQWLRYGLEHHAELEFVQRNPLHAMRSSLQAFRCQLIETRVRQEQQDRGRARGQANKRCQMWHLSGLRSDDD